MSSDTSCQIVTVYCGVCGAMFSSWNDYDSHYTYEHLREYGPWAYGVHPMVKINNSSHTKVNDDE